MPNSKQCSKCGETKPLDDFNRWSRSSDGRRTQCRECTKAHSREYQSRPEVRKRRAEYGATPKAKARKAEYYAKHMTLPEARVRKAEYHAKYYAANRERVLNRQAEYQARPEVQERLAAYRVENVHLRWAGNYRRRVIRYGLDALIDSMEDFTKADVIDEYGDQCWHCGGPFEELDHHPVAVAHGGLHTLENTKPTCVPCNRKGAAVRTQNRQEMTA